MSLTPGVTSTTSATIASPMSNEGVQGAPLVPAQATGRPGNDYCSALTQKVKSVGARIWTAISELCGKRQGKWVRLPGKWYEPGVSEKATSCFHTLMPPHSQRENWNTVNPYVTEFWSTVSTVSFFAIGAIYGEPLIMIAGAASALQHTFPKAWLVKADQFIATSATLAIGVRYNQGFYKQPGTTIPVALGVGGAFVFDMHNAQHQHYNFAHTLWHTAAACGCYVLMQAADGEKLF